MNYILTQSQIKPIVDSYLRKQTVFKLEDVFDKLRAVRDNYIKTGDDNNLRYLLALCLRCRHGWRIPWKETKRAVDKLQESDILNKSFSDFERLYKNVENLLGDIPFVRGDLTLYDTSVNIGQLLNPKVEPKDYVYLTAGAREGAGYIIGKKYVSRIMPTSVFAPIFHGIHNIDIENGLCIYKKLFKKLAEGNTLTDQEIDEAYNPHCFNLGSKEVYFSHLNNCDILY